MDDCKPELLYKILLDKIRQSDCQVSETLTAEHTAEDGRTYIPLLSMVTSIHAEKTVCFGNAREMVALAHYAMTRSVGRAALPPEDFYGGLGKIDSTYFSLESQE